LNVSQRTERYIKQRLEEIKGRTPSRQDVDPYVYKYTSARLREIRRSKEKEE
jgi:hypothetical protein